MIAMQKELTLTTLQGKTYTLSPFTVDDLRQLAAKCKAQYANPLEVVGAVYDKLPEAMRKELTDRAYQDAVRGGDPTIYQMAQGLDSIDGVVESLLLSIGKRHPEVTAQEIVDFIADLPEDEIEKLKIMRDQLSPHVEGLTAPAAK
jgi:hypothetical protein